MQSMKKLLKGETSSSSGLLDCGENQLHAALSMEARTRSPLPPSPTTSTTLHDIETLTDQHSEKFDKKSQFNKHKDLNFINDKSTSVKRKIHIFEMQEFTGEARKPMPSKPPRKNLYIKAHEKQENSNFSKYDEIEMISDAWRTLGTDDVNHTENINETLEEEYVSWGRKEPIFAKKLPKAVKVITECSTPHEDSYDKLSFFGSSSKLNVNKGGYKQITPLPISSAQNYTPSFNYYDEVNVLEGVRLADDSHLGYALIKRGSKDPPVNHVLCNNEPYALISKPKRV